MTVPSAIAAPYLVNRGMNSALLGEQNTNSVLAVDPRVFMQPFALGDSDIVGYWSERSAQRMGLRSRLPTCSLLASCKNFRAQIFLGNVLLFQTCHSHYGIQGISIACRLPFIKKVQFSVRSDPKMETKEESWVKLMMNVYARLGPEGADFGLRLQQEEVTAGVMNTTWMQWL